MPTIDTLPAVVRRHAAMFPLREAAVDANIRVTYSTLAERMIDAAAALRSLGLVPGERVAFFGFPGISYLETFLAVLDATCVYVGLNPKSKSGELSYLIGHAAPRLIIVDGRVSPSEFDELRAAIGTLREAPCVVACSDGELAASLSRAALAGAPEKEPPFPIVPSDAAALVYTSGTTGLPKGAVIRHRGFVHEGTLFVERFLDGDVSRITRVLNNLPVNHIGCLGDLTGAWLVMAATIVFMPRFSPAMIGQVLREERITFYFQVPAMFQLALQQGGLDLTLLPELRDVGWGGAPCPQPLIDMFARASLKLVNTYGLSEGTGTSTATRQDASIDALASTVGVPLEDGTVRLGAENEIELAGKLVFAGYLRDEAATKAAFTDDGWFRTGDIGAWDAHGNLMLMGRRHEMFKSGGYNVYPREVEDVIERFPGVELAAVVAVPDPIWVEVGYAFVQGEEAVNADALSSYVKSKLANYKVPKKFTIMRSLPRLAIGKIDKQALKKMTSTLDT